MDERNPAAASARAGLLIDQGVALGATGSERRVEVGNTVAHVMNAGTTATEETTDRRIGTSGLEQLDLAATEIEMDDPGTVDFIGASRGHPEHVTIEPQRRFNVLDGDAKVGDSRIHVRNI